MNYPAIAAVAGIAASSLAQVTVSVVPTATTVDTRTQTSVSVSVVVDGIDFETESMQVGVTPDGEPIIETDFITNLAAYGLDVTIDGSEFVAGSLNVLETGFSLTSIPGPTFITVAVLASFSGPFDGLGSVFNYDFNLGPFDETITLFEFDVDTSDLGEITLQAAQSMLSPLDVATSETVSGPISFDPTNPVFVGATITVVPAPGVAIAAAFVSCGTLSRRRRRPSAISHRR